MKPNKGIYNRVNPIDQPEDTLFYGRNMILNEKYGSWYNESGFTISSINFPYKPIGAISIEDKVIIFTTNDIYSALGIYDEKTDIYTPIFDNNPLNVSISKINLGFNSNYPISGIAKRNFRGEIIVTFTDDNTTPKYINLSTVTNLQQLKDFLLFPLNNTPIITLSSINETGGAIPSGVLFVAIQHKSNDGTISNWSRASGPIRIVKANISEGITNYVGVEAGTVTTKSVTLELKNIDINYDSIKVAIISKINGIISVKLIPEISIKGLDTFKFIYTGTETTEDVTNDEILVSLISYATIGSFTSINDSLYGAKLSSNDLLRLQKYFVNAKIYYTSKLTNVNELGNAGGDAIFPSQVLGTTPRGFLHGETYAFYGRAILLDDTRTAAFHIPGRPSNIGDTSPTVFTDLSGSLKYQIEDTSSNQLVAFQGAGLSGGDMGYWENQDEIYIDNAPDSLKDQEYNGEIDYNGNTIIGGINLVGKKIRHHRFPSIATCKSKYYFSNTDYGKTVLDVLGIVVNNVKFPSDILDKIQGWEILYAQRDVNNYSVVSQSLLQYGAEPFNGSSGDGRLWSTGGNFDMDDNDGASEGGKDQSHINYNSMRFYGFDLLYGKPKIQPTYIENTLKLTTRFSSLDPEGNTINKNNLRIYLNWVGSDANVSNISTPDKFRKISLGQHVPRNSNTNIGGVNVYNLGLEAFYYAHIDSGGPNVNAPHVEIDVQSGYTSQDGLYTITSYLTNLCVVKSTMYNSFLSQTLISTGAIQLDKTQTSLTNIYGGDIFITVHSYMTFGPRSPKDNDDYNNYNKVIQKFLCESQSMIQLRHEVLGKGETKFWDKTNTGDMLAINATATVNEWAYNKDYTSINDLTGGSIFNPLSRSTNKFPYRVIRSKIASKEEQGKISWKAFSPNDYYESVQNRGEIINIQGFGNDRLLIHHKNGLYITVGNNELKTDITSVTIGSGDIFASPAKEVIESRDGEAGTQNKFSCLLTPYGYIFVDQSVGKIWNFDGISGNGKSPIEEISVELRTFLRDNLTIVPVDGSIDNPFKNTGISLAYDQHHKRLLLSVKNLAPLTGTEYLNYIAAQTNLTTANNLLVIATSGGDPSAIAEATTNVAQATDSVASTYNTYLNTNTSYTLSYYPESKCWGLFHDYIPDFIFNTREKLYSFKTQNNVSKLFIHNFGSKGIYYNVIENTPTPYSSYIDIVFKSKKDGEQTMTEILESVGWVSEIIDNTGLIINEQTIDYITIRNSYQTSGKIHLSIDTDIMTNLQNNRNPDGTWYFNEFRDIVKDRTKIFIDTILNEYKIIPTNIDENLSWFDKPNLAGKFHIIRLEYSNLNNNLLYLYEAHINSRLSFR